jgi:hypothetical protein
MQATDRALLPLTWLIGASLMATPPQEVPAAPKVAVKRPNAATLYLAAADGLPRALGVDSVYDVRLPEPLAEDPRARRYEEASWDDLVTKVANELGLFAQAAHTTECTFGQEGDDGLLACDMMISPLFSLAQLTAAHGWGCSREGTFEASLHDASTLLAFSRQFGAQSSSSAMAIGSQVELNGLALLRGVFEVGAPLAEPTHRKAAAMLEEHARARPGRRTAAVGVRAEVKRILQHAASKAPATAAEREAPVDDVQRVLRESLDAVAAQVDARLERWLTPLTASDDVPLAELIAQVEANMTAARAQVKGLKVEALKKDRTREQVLDYVADILVTLLLRSPQEVVQNDAYSREEIAACRKLVADVKRAAGK